MHQAESDSSMRTTFQADFVQAVKETTAGAVAILAIPLAVVGYFIEQNKHYDIESKWLILLLLAIYLLLFLCYVLFFMVVAARRKAQDDLPKTLKAFEHNNKLHLLLEPSERFVINGVVSIQLKDNDLEISVGLGRISDIQSNGKIQVEVLRADFDSELWQKVKSQRDGVISNLFVKQYVPLEPLLEAVND